MRQIDPVHKSPFNIVVLTRHADVNALLRHPAVSSMEQKAEVATKTGLIGKVLGRGSDDQETGPFFDLMDRTMLFRDPPDHTRLRALVSKAFTPKRTEALSGRVRIDDPSWPQPIWAILLEATEDGIVRLIWRRDKPEGA